MDRADAPNPIVGMGVNMGISRGLGALGARSPIPLPSFYNGNSQHPFADSQANRMLHGDTDAMRRYAGKVGGAAIGNAIFPVIGGLAGGYLGPHIADLLTGHGWSGNKTPVGTVRVGDINTAGDGSGARIDPNTGQVSYMPSFNEGTTGSAYGPMADGYRGSALPSNVPDDFVMPDFSQYADMSQFDNPEERRDARRDYNDTRSGLYGVSNFMVGGAPVINGMRPAMDPNGRAVYNKRDIGG